MIWFILGFIASYIIGVIGWSIALMIEKSWIETFDDLREELCDSPGIIPFINIILLVGAAIIAAVVAIVMFIYECSGIEKLWDKIKDKKLPFRKQR